MFTSPDRVLVLTMLPMLSLGMMMTRRFTSGFSWTISPRWSFILRYSQGLYCSEKDNGWWYQTLMAIGEKEGCSPVWLVASGVCLLAQVEIIQGHGGWHGAGDHGQPRGRGEGGHRGHAGPWVRHHAAVSLARPGANTEMMTVRFVETILICNPY